jgi:hypothetical protein
MERGNGADLIGRRSALSRTPDPTERRYLFGHEDPGPPRRRIAGAPAHLRSPAGEHQVLRPPQGRLYPGRCAAGPALRTSSHWGSVGRAGYWLANSKLLSGISNSNSKATSRASTRSALLHLFQSLIQSIFHLMLGEMGACRARPLDNPSQKIDSPGPDLAACLSVCGMCVPRLRGCGFTGMCVAMRSDAGGTAPIVRQTRRRCNPCPRPKNAGYFSGSGANRSG